MRHPIELEVVGVRDDRIEVAEHGIEPARLFHRVQSERRHDVHVNVREDAERTEPDATESPDVFVLRR